MNVAILVGSVTLLGALAVLLWLRRRLLVVRVEGSSMRPTFRPGEWVLVRRIEPGDLRRGDVVVVERPEQPGLRPPMTDARRVRGRSWMIKRVHALSGEPVPANVATALGISSASQVPGGHIVLIGDNAAASHDSRAFGFFPTDRLLGVVVRRLEG